MSEKAVDLWKNEYDISEITDKDLIENSDKGLGLYDQHGDVWPLTSALSDVWDISRGLAVDRAVRLFISCLLSRDELKEIKREYEIMLMLPPSKFAQSTVPIDVDISSYEQGEKQSTLSAYTTPTIYRIIEDELLGGDYKKQSHLTIDALYYVCTGKLNTGEVCSTTTGEGRGDSNFEETNQGILNHPYYLVELFGSEARRTLVQWLLDHAEEQNFEEHSKAEIIRETGVARKTIIEHIDLLLEFGVIVEVGSETRPRYRIPEDGPLYDLITMNEKLAQVHGSSSFNPDSGTFD